MIIRRSINGGEWEYVEIEFGILEDDCDDEPLECMYCDSPASVGHYTCGSADCVYREIVAQVEDELISEKWREEKERAKWEAMNGEKTDTTS